MRMSQYQILHAELLEAAEDTPKETRASPAQCSLLAILLEEAGLSSDEVTNSGRLTKARASVEIDRLKRSR